MHTKATTKIIKYRVIANKLTKEIKQNPKIYYINFFCQKKAEKVERGNKQQMGQIENK